MKDLDISKIDDKVSWNLMTSFTMVVRKPGDTCALSLNLVPHGDGWILAKMVVGGGSFDAMRGAAGRQELVGEFDDFQEALAAGSTVARKWLADPVA